MTDNLVFAVEGAWQVLLAGLVLGAGLPALFAVGVRSLAWSAGGSAEVQSDQPPHPLGRVLAGLCFAVVVVGIALGLTVILAAGQGKMVSFEHGYPTIVAES